MKTTEGYTINEIAGSINRPARTVKHWSDIGIVKPDVAEARGKGSTRIFSKFNLIQFAMVDYMAADMGLPLYAIMSAIEAAPMGSLVERDLGKNGDVLLCLETKNIHLEQEVVEWRYLGGSVREGQFESGSSGSLKRVAGQLKIHIEMKYRYSEDRPNFFTIVDQWAASHKIHGFSLLRMGAIRDEAVKKHGLTLKIYKD